MSTTAGALIAGFAALPLASAAEIAGGTCLILAPHPDDESLGCGGLIARLCADGTPPVVVILTDGSGSHPNSARYPATRLAALREAEAADAVRCLGLPPDRLHFLRARDTAAPHDGAGLKALSARLAELAARHGAATLLTTWVHDPHCDHVAAWRIGRDAAAQAGLRLLCYPVWGLLLAEDTVLPDLPWRGWRLDIAAELQAKRAAIAAHASQGTGLIDDDPDGFRLPAALLAVFARDTELFLEPPEGA